MQMCSRPGCVAAAVDLDDMLCAVHRDHLGKPCDRCKGTGKVQRRGDLREYTTEPCEQCGGVGLRDHKQAPKRSPRGSDPVDGRTLTTLMNPDEQEKK